MTGLPSDNGCLIDARPVWWDYAATSTNSGDDLKFDMPRGKNHSAEVLKVEGPTGLSIVLRRETWDNHILPRHAELAPFISAIQDVLENPDMILEGKPYKGRDRHIYVKDNPIRVKPYGDKQLAVYVDVPGNRRKCHVCTAHFAKGIGIRKGQRAIYKRA